MVFMEVLSRDLVIAAAGVAVIHTALGPDHILPFVFLARARGWKLPRTLAVTLACGAGHVASSLLLGAIGVGLGLAVSRIEIIEAIRGDTAAWAMVALGGAYALWGLRKGLRKRAGLTPHVHDGNVHIHRHGNHTHHHKVPLTSQTHFWVLFSIFVLGPCEPLIPLFVVPAGRGRWELAALVAVVFTVCTLATMLVMVGLAATSLQRLPLGAAERWSHALAGTVIAFSGLAVLFLGL
jgi:sulfite exporter TauE/SafE